MPEEVRRGRGRPRGSRGGGRPPGILPDNRLQRRNENARMVEPPDNLSLNRSPSSNGAGASAAIKAAVLASLLMGDSAYQISDRFNIPLEDVVRWERSFSISNPAQRNAQLSELLLIFVRQGLSSIMAMDIATSDEDWIKSQNAHDLATLFGVKHDRLLRLLETFGRANNAAVVEEDEEE
jgi:hypothetical protein